LAGGLASAFAYQTSIGTDRILRLKGELAGNDLAQARELIAELDVWGTAEDGSLEVRAAPKYALVFEKLGLNVTDGTEEHLTHFRWFADHYDEQVCTKSAHECAYGADPFYNKYQPWDAINQYLTKLQTTYKDLIVSQSWGKSGSNRDQQGVIITGNKGSGPKDIVFYFCGEHAREWLPPMFCVWMVENLAAKYGQDAKVTGYMDKYEFHILPVMNPDGYTYSFTNDNMWRKSRKTNPGSSCVGTDLNRNYAFKWGTGGSSTDPCSETYMGKQPWDNKETANLEEYSKKGRIVIQTDVHAYGRMWMHPWGYTTALCKDDAAMTGAGQATVAAIRATHGQVFAEGSIANVIYIASGSSCDYFYGTTGVIYAYAPEVRGTSFQPPASNIIPSNEELWAGMLAQVEYVSTH